MLSRVGATVVLLGSCGGCYGEPEPAVLDDGDNGARVSLAMSQEVHLTLHTVGPGQYGEPTVSSPAVRFLGMSFPGRQNPGGPTQLYKFEGVADGNGAISIPHDGQAAPFTLSIDCCAK